MVLPNLFFTLLFTFLTRPSAGEIIQDGNNSGSINSTERTTPANSSADDSSFPFSHYDSSTLSKSSKTRICQNIDVRNRVSNLAQLRGCRVVEGYLQVVLIDHANETDFDDFSFPELREVTQYILLYRVSGLRSVGQLFPSLSLIRGNAVFEDYALVVYEMFHLQEVGLHALAEISRGAVRIEKNPNLCFLNTINWDLLARWDSVKNYIAHNKDPADCPGGSVCRQAGCPLGLCWSSTHCQMQVNNTYKDCDTECLGGCSGPGPRACHSCRKYLTADGTCVSSCPDNTYLHLNRRCLNRDHCLSLVDQSKLKYVVFNGTCTQTCPPGYDFTQDKKGCEKCEKGKCRKVCPGLSIDNVAAAQNLRGCTFINGSLEIAIKHGKHKILAEELEESLKSIEEIKGYLKIIRCFPLVNLKFFKNLEIIYGYEPFLENGKYSLIILDNQNLQELWDLNSDFKILNGRIFLHYNPKLCFHYIETLISITGLMNISNFEVAQESNGDKFACNTTVVELQFTIVNPYNIGIAILLPNRTSPQPNLQRYVLYYAEAETRNMTLFEETDECDDDSWRVRDILLGSDNKTDKTEERPLMREETLQTHLKPFTQYAFYVKTYTVSSIGGQSPIYYVRTKPAQPSEVTMKFAFSNSTSSIVLKWEHPKHPNGILSGYIFTGFWQKDERTVVDQRNYCVYPMVEEPVEQLLPNILTTVLNETKNCCSENKMSYRSNGKYGRLCNNYQRQLYLDQHVEEDRLSCNKYFYNYIFQDSLEKKEQSQKKSKKLKHKNKVIKREILFQNSKYISLANLQNDKLENKSNNNSFFIVANNVTTIFSINNLHHFAKYTIFVRACRQKNVDESDDNYEERCSKSVMVTIRTLKDPTADNVASELVTQDILEEDYITVLEISWSEPKDPNGVIVAFEIEHRKSDLVNAKAITECLTYNEYINNGRKYVLRGLLPGKYTYRIRAVSLAGSGKFTKSFPFEIKTITSMFFHIILLFIVIVFISLFVAIGYYIMKRRRGHWDLDLLIAPAYVEHTSAPPYIEDSWEIPRENVQILRELGKGSFGNVYQGILYPLKIPCAVKTANEESNSQWRLFLNETRVMKRAVGVHHLVQLLGVVSRGGPPLVVMELMSLGDLKTYLRSTRDVPLQSTTFFLMAAQIADAMFFMESNKFVHRDLAARNCMVSKDLTVKVGDFGLTRDVYSTDYYQKGNKAKLPIRWMAPESLRDGVYTSKSDVWSFGVVLWEVATLAEQPYRGLSNEEVLREVLKGLTLPLPLVCPPSLLSLMSQCWRRSPDRRPSFWQLVQQLEPHTDELFKCVSYYHITLDQFPKEDMQQPRVKLTYNK